jgi:hypothetical protein
MTFKPTFLLAFWLLLATPSVFGQKKRGDCSQVISIGGGAHQFTINNFKGHNYNLNVENTTGQHTTFLLNVRNLTEKSNLHYLLPKSAFNKTIFEHKVNMQGGINWYPMSALHGFYAGMGVGAYIHINNHLGRPVSSTNGQFDAQFLRTTMGLSNDVKIGYQQVFKSGLVCNLHINAGLFHPITERLKFASSDGLVLIGLNFGKSFG